jgi:mono/diheme cytochrome c family protein
VGGVPGPVLADEDYLRESILEPTRKLAAGFQSGEQAMPSYAGILSEEELKSVIEYIKSLR